MGTNYRPRCQPPPEKALVGIINNGLDTSYPGKEFEKLWNYWWNRFPNACILITLTKGHFDGDDQELRFWFGEPTFFGSQHVDSNGHNLIVTVRGGHNSLKSLVYQIIPIEKFKKSVIDPDDKNTITVASKIMIWRRIKKS